VQSFIQNYGYWALLLLSVATSACIPIPSEVIFVFAGALCTTAVTGHAQLSLWAVIVVGSLGSLIGAQIAYEVARYAGRAIVERWGKWLLVSTRDLDTSQRFFDKYGALTVSVGRVIPFIRSFVSLPAGIAEMARVRFASLSLLGSAAWIVLLTALGYGAGSSWKHVSHGFHDAQDPVIIVVVIALAAAIFWRIRSVRRDSVK